MRILIIRHGDPDYSIDSLTEKGWKEAEILSHRLSQLDIRNIYVSPMGRAQDTARATLKALDMTAETLPWLHEFDIPITDVSTGEKRLAWDLLPQVWTNVPENYDKDLWHTTPDMAYSHVYDEAKKVYDGLDEILKKHGYVRNKNCYVAVEPNRDTIVFVCHFGVECVMLGYLLGISPMVLWHSLCAAPTSVTTLYSEERRKGTAYFRLTNFADVAHLYAENEPSSFAARFCETFDSDERHD